VEVLCLGKILRKFHTTTPWDAHTASLRLALSYAGFLMTLLATRQEVSKKRAQAFPLGTPGIAALQSEQRRKTYVFLCISRHQPTRAADMPTQKVLRVP
jgi:hypothetical protein